MEPEIIEDEFRSKVSIFHFPYQFLDNCEVCFSKEGIKTYSERTIDKVWKNWTHINGITLCSECFNKLKYKCDIYYVKDK